MTVDPELTDAIGRCYMEMMRLIANHLCNLEKMLTVSQKIQAEQAGWDDEKLLKAYDEIKRLEEIEDLEDQMGEP